ncbi:MAG TPA: hypothetical protein VIK29_07130 [Paludibacter sp.]
MNSTPSKSLSDIMRINKAEKLINAYKRDTEIDEILLETAFNDPQFQVLVSEQNAIGVTIATLTGAKMFQNLVPSY